MKTYKGTKIIRVYRDGVTPDEVFYENIKPSTCTIDDYLSPAAEFLATVIALDSKKEAACTLNVQAVKEEIYGQ